jgi:HD-GYP domain-containing protein (c-di-GMP phosphodiesterase class II)
MSSDPRRGVHSQAAERAAASGSQVRLVELIRARGETLLAALERHWAGSRAHADGTATFAFATAVELGWGREPAEEVREAARLHDVGLVYVPAETLSRAAGDLTVEERTLLDSRFARGAALARAAAVPEAACEWIRAVGERFDGGGPSGLAGERIPAESRVIRTACLCDAVLAGAAPVQAPPGGRHRLALDELRRRSGAELDPRVSGALAGVLERAAGGI